MKRFFLFVALAGTLFACTPADQKAGTPEYVAKQYVENFMKGDFAEAKKHVLESSQQGFDMLIFFSQGKTNDIDFTYTRTRTVKEGEVTTVYYKIDEGQEEQSISLVQENGEWKIAFGK